MTGPIDRHEAGPTATTRADQRLGTALRFATLLALLLACAALMSRNTADADLWGHIQFGLETLAAGHPLATASHTYTATGYPWFNHENLSEIALAVVNHFGGGAGLLAAKCLLSLLLVGSMIVVARRRQQVSVAALWMAMTIVTLNLSPGWTLRPQLATAMLLSAMVLILDAAFEFWTAEGRVRTGALWLLPPLMIVWANAHGGFVAGAALLALYLGIRAVEALARFGRSAWPLLLRLSLVGLLTAAATLVTPYGAPYLHWLYGDLSVPRPEIAEWSRLTIRSLSFWPAMLMFGLCGTALYGTTRRRDPAQVILILAAAAESLAHGRHLPLMAVLVGYWIPTHLESVFAQVRAAVARAAAAATAPRGAPRQSGSRGWTVALLFAMAVLCAALGGLLVQRTSQLWVDRTEFPVGAVDYMARHHLTGRLVATFNWAEYALAALPETSTNFDGRCRTCYPQSINDLHFDFVLGDDPRLRWRSPKSPPPSGTGVLDFGHPDLVLLDRRQPPSVQAIAQQPRQWVLLYQDEIAQVWGRRSRFGNPLSVDFIPPPDRLIGDQPQQGLVAWPALPSSIEAGSRTSGQFPPLKLHSHRGAT